MAVSALRRQTPKVGAVCGNAARTVLCGGRPVTGVPTAIESSSRARPSHQPPGPNALARWGPDRAHTNRPGRSPRPSRPPEQGPETALDRRREVNRGHGHPDHRVNGRIRQRRSSLDHSMSEQRQQGSAQQRTFTARFWQIRCALAPAGKAEPDLR